MRKYISLLIIYTLIFTFLGSIIYSLLKDSGIDDQTMSVIINLSIYIIILTTTLILLKGDIVTDFTEFFSQKRKIDAVLLGYLYLIAGNFIANILLSIIGVQDLTSENQGSIESLIKARQYLIIIPVVFIAPFVEELVFRKSIFSVLNKLNINKYVTLIFSSLVFGLIHVAFNLDNGYTELLLGIPYIISGLAFGLIYLKNNENVYVPIIVHFINNFLAIILTMSMMEL